MADHINFFIQLIEGTDSHGGEFYGFCQITSAVAFDLAIPFPGVYLTDIPAEAQKDIRAIILMAALFVIRILEAPSVHQWGGVK